ncbi:MAG: hypothetical protein KatS3mg061_2356 [Dehalococcoidia bacterium]|nr:MAG: hypothetical protein KatS3mg061_2356 [Dehalococcoidia bacterium]
MVRLAPPPPAAPPLPRAATPAENLGLALLGLWTVVGLFLDGWAHENLAGLETFFTPWHGVLYSGLVAMAGWTAAIVQRRWQAGWRGGLAIPPGYQLGVAGLALFGVGGLADFAWHTAFGIERGIDALLSPPHLTMGLGALLTLTSPWRAAWSDGGGGARPGWRVFLPVLLSTALATAVVAFFFMYLSVFTGSDPSARRATASLLSSKQVGIAAVLLTNVVLFAPLLLLLRRWVLPFGSATLLFTLTAGLMGALAEYRFWPAVLALALGGMGVDGIGWLLRPTPAHARRVRLFALLAPLLVWALFFALIALTRGLSWSLELVGGSLAWTSLSGLALSLLLFPPPLAQDPPAGA